MLTVMTYNIRYGAHHDRGLAAIAEVIQPHQPRILGLQEVQHTPNDPDLLGQDEDLAARLNMHSVFAPSSRLDDGVLFGNALLVHPSLHIREHNILNLEVPDLRQYPDISPWWYMPRNVLYALVDDAIVGVPLRVLVTHLGLTPPQRRRQVEQIITLLQTWHPTAPAVLMGDFNTLPHRWEIQYLHHSLRDVLQNMAGPQRWTVPSGPTGTVDPDDRSMRDYTTLAAHGLLPPDEDPPPQRPSGWAGELDYLLHTPDLTCHHAHVIHDETCASDHNPIIATLSYTPHQAPAD